MSFRFLSHRVVRLIISSFFLVFLYILFISSPSEKSKISLKELLAISINAAHKGGEEIVKVNLKAHLVVKSKGKTKEGANDPLTEADLASHYTIVKSLNKYFPTLTSVISEEHSDANFNPSYVKSLEPDYSAIKSLGNIDFKIAPEDITVWVDPLDATQEFTENLLKYVTTMICVAVKGKPTIGVIHQPFINKTSWAWVGHGSNVIVPQNESSHLKVIVSRSHAGKVTELVPKIFGSDAHIIRAGGAGYKVLQLLENKADIYLHVTHIKKWDICAGHALLKSFGGDLLTLHKKKVDYLPNNSPIVLDGVLASLHSPKKYIDKLNHE